MNKKGPKKEPERQIKNSSTFKGNQKYKKLSKMQGGKIIKSKKSQGPEEISNTIPFVKNMANDKINRKYFKKYSMNQDIINNNEDNKIQEEFPKKTNIMKVSQSKREIKENNNKLEKKDQNNKKPKKNKNMSADKIVSLQSYNFKKNKMKKKNSDNSSHSEKSSESEESSSSSYESDSEKESEKSEESDKPKKEKENSSKKGKKEKNEVKDNPRPSKKPFAELSSLNNNENETKIKGSKYLRRRSLDNPMLKEKYESLFNQMILKQNGGDSLFLKNYEKGPTYKKEIEMMIKNKKVKKK